MKFINFFLASVLWFVMSNVYATTLPAWKKLMPRPQKIEIRKGVFKVDKDIRVVIPRNATQRVRVAATKFIRRLTNRTGLFVINGFPLMSSDNSNYCVTVSYKRKGELKLHEDESYRIDIASQQIVLQAETDIGIIYAFETLLQLLDHDADNFFFQNCHIEDKPAFTWRGLLIDVSRHFQPVSVIKRNLDAMLVAKLNTFHWHLSDDQGFRVQINQYPQLTDKASDGQFYTQEQVKEVVQYAADRGIRVVPEIDVPGHATAILVAFPEIGSKKMTYRLQRNAGIFDPTLDPSNPQTYVVLNNIFKELSALFPFTYFHIGGDENRGKHWNNNSDIQAFMKNKGFKTNHELQTYFNQKLVKILEKYHKKMMGWDEIMTPGVPQSALIHVWRGKKGKRLAETVKKGYQAVLSNGFYIDLMLPAYSHYQNHLYPEKFNLTQAEKQHVLGGEATMWGELVTPLTIDSRIWPRTLAIGERLWTNPSVTDRQEMYQRMFAQSWHLEELGIQHLSAKEIILRNITENQNTDALKVLTGVYEPLKYYTRNKGGTEYQTYSPFMCFADACSADAPDALQFSFVVNKYLDTRSDKDKRTIIKLLKKWSNNHKQLVKLKPNPKLQKLLPMSQSLADLTLQMLVLANNLIPVDQAFVNRLKLQYQKAIQPYNDVSLANAEAFKELIVYWIKQRNLKWQ